MPVHGSCEFLEARISTLYGPDSLAMQAYDLVKKEMCKENGHTRYDGSDYYVHCVAVANNLITLGILDQDVICAALLHDIVEDVTGYNLKVIAILFNERISRLVGGVTKDPSLDYKLAENMYAYLAVISMDMYCCLIKTADRMNNMNTIKEASVDSIYAKAMETKIYYIPFFKKCAKLYRVYQNIFFIAKDSIEGQISVIEKMYEEIEIRRKHEADLLSKFELLENEITSLKETSN